MASLELVEERRSPGGGHHASLPSRPDKKLQNMMQLSGGEKALTAIALLFAHPEPETVAFLSAGWRSRRRWMNPTCARYANYLHKLTKNTQFIIITHRRGTMAAADRLYGITMQEKGVSVRICGSG